MSPNVPEKLSDDPGKFPVHGTVHSDEARPGASPATEPQPVGTGSAATGAARPAAGPQEPTAELAAVDTSVRLPVLLFFMSSLSWLVLGSALGFFGTLKFSFPGLLSEFGWLTIGRVLPAASASMTYGWAASAGIGAGLWLLARLCRVPVRHGGVLVGAWLLWNLGVTLGVASILYGQGTSYNTLEFPYYVAPLLLSAFIFVAVWALLLYRHRRDAATYPSQWYVLAAFLWFPWMYATGNLMVFLLGIQAPAQAVVAAWYAHSLLHTFFVPLALAVAYYIIPKVTGQPIHRLGWAKFGFWTWLFFSSWAGTYELIGGPVPAWMSSVAIVATLLTILPLFVLMTNLLGTMRGREGGLRHSPSLRFVVVGVYCFLAADLAAVFMGFRGVNAVAHFTLLTVAGGHLLMYGFVSFVLFGALYYIVPRLLGTEWASPALLRSHFWYAVAGLGLVVVSYGLGGIVQGFGLEDPKVPMIALLSFIKPFFVSGLVGVLLMLVGHVCLIASFSLILVRLGYVAIQRRPVVATGPRTAVTSGGTAPATSALPAASL